MPETPDWGAGRNYDILLTQNQVLGPFTGVSFDVRPYNTILIWAGNTTATTTTLVLIWYDSSGQEIDREMIAVEGNRAIYPRFQVRSEQLSITNAGSPGTSVTVTVSGSATPLSEPGTTEYNASEVAYYDTGNINMAINTVYVATPKNWIEPQINGLAWCAAYISATTMTGELALRTNYCDSVGSATQVLQRIAISSQFVSMGNHLYWSGLIAVPRGQYSLAWIARTAVNPCQVQAYLIKA